MMRPLLLGIGILLGICVPLRAATPEQVQASIEKGRQYLYTQFGGNCWEQAGARGTEGAGSLTGAQYGGLTALATYALLASGESAQQPQILKAVEFLKSADMIGTYALGLRAQVWLNLPPSKDVHDAILRDSKLLVAARKTKGATKGLYFYTKTTPSGYADHSTSQYGVLGVWAGSEVAEVPSEYWSDVDEVWRKDQGDDGSWSYATRPGTIVEDKKTGTKVATVGTASMTAAGVATLFITQEFLYRTQGIRCTGNINDRNIDAGMKWMSDHFASVFNTGIPMYTLYGIEVERIGVASGYKYFGDVDWYQLGADWIIKHQQPTGAFTGNSTVTGIENTAFGLLFLSRGRAPVLMNKLQFNLDGKEAHWNQRPRDVFYMTRWMGKQMENPLNWQIMNMDRPVKDWHDAPILFISGNQTLHFTPEEQAKLKQFAEEGGLILGNADCGDESFSTSFRKLGLSLFPQYEFQPLPLTNLILHDEQFPATRWKQKPTILSLSNGTREMMMLIGDTDPGKQWQIGYDAGHEEAFQLAADIFLYSVDKSDLHQKGDTYIVEPDKSKSKRTIQVSRLRYAGNWDPEPAGWRRLNAVMHNTDHADVTATTVDLVTGKLTGPGIAHLTGTGTCALTSPAKLAITTFVQNGGTLIVDAAGGDPAFTSSVETQLRSIFGSNADQLLQPLPADHPLYSTAAGPLTVKYRHFARAKLGNLKVPQLRAISQNGRIVCIYSKEDLSAGLVGQAVDGIIGYDPASATAVMRNILLYLTKPASKATTKP